MPNIEIKQATTEDAMRISKVAIQTYLETYSHELMLMTDQVRSQTLTKILGEDIILSKLLNPAHRFLIAVDNANNVLGYIHIELPTTEITELHSEIADYSARSHRDLNDIAFLSKFYVLGKFQGKGVGRMLMAEAVAHAIKMSKKCLLLMVYSSAPGLRFYQQQGFTKTGYEKTFPWDCDGQDGQSIPVLLDYEMVHTDLPHLLETLSVSDKKIKHATTGAEISLSLWKQKKSESGDTLTPDDEIQQAQELHALAN